MKTYSVAIQKEIVLCCGVVRFDTSVVFQRLRNSSLTKSC